MGVRLQDPGEVPGGPTPLIFRPKSRQTFFEACPAPLSQGLDDRPPLSEGLDPPLDCNQFALKKERERELMLLKLYSIILCADLVIDIDIDREKVYFTTRYTGVATR